MLDHDDLRTMLQRKNNGIFDAVQILFWFTVLNKFDWLIDNDHVYKVHLCHDMFSQEDVDLFCKTPTQQTLISTVIRQTTTVNFDSSVYGHMVLCRIDRPV